MVYSFGDVLLCSAALLTLVLLVGLTLRVLLHMFWPSAAAELCAPLHGERSRRPGCADDGGSAYGV